MMNFLQILGGLSLFLYGIRLLSAGMEKLAGDQIQKWLDKATSNLFKSALFGTVATALLHSSGLLMVTMIGLINANLMTVTQAIGVMLGQEIGTTLTAQIVAFKIGNFNMLFVVAGILLLEFVDNREWKKYGEISLGIGIVFLGMTLMAAALGNLMELVWVKNALSTLGQYPLTAVAAGLVATALVQSSTAVTSTTVAMGMSNAISLEGAVGIILGANIGSCVTGFIASLRLSRTARQASMAQIIINLIGVLLFLPFISPYAGLIEQTSVNLARQIANAHTIFNVIVSLLLMPFIKQIAWAAERLIPANTRTETSSITAYIDTMQFSVPSVALNEATRELVRLGDATSEMFAESCQSLINKNAELARRVIEREDNFVDPLYKTISDFASQLMSTDMSISQQKRCLQIKNLLVDIERVGDMAEDIAQFTFESIENNVIFSVQANQELDDLWQHVHKTYSLAIRAFESGDKFLAGQVCQLESDFDHLYWRARQQHIDRLEQGICQPEANVIFTETLRLLERVSDHADNLGISIART